MKERDSEYEIFSLKINIKPPNYRFIGKQFLNYQLKCRHKEIVAINL